MAENEIRIKDLPSTQQINETDDVIVLDNATDGTRKLQGKVLLDMIHSAMAKGTASGAVATFTDGSDGIPMTDLVVSIEPQQSGSGEPSPTNIRPISGWTACNVVRSGGQNYLNVPDRRNVRNNYIFNATDVNIPVGTYVFSFNVVGNPTNLFELYDATSGSNVSLGSASMQEGENTLTFTTNTAITKILAFTNTSVAVNITDIKINQSNTFTINFVDGSSPLTVYGGTLDVLSGVLTVDRVYVDLGTLNYSYYSGNLFTTPISNLKPVPNEILCDALCSIYVAKRGNEYSSIDSSFVAGFNNARILAIHDSRFTDATAFKTAMSGVQLVYELSTPQTYQLTPTEVKSLLGVNNIYADTGNVLNAEYVRDTTTIINQILARLDALEG